MNSAPSVCPRCGATLPPDSPQGLCPQCLLQSALAETAAGAKPPAASAPIRLPYFGDYELIEEIARGGMGVVYRARQVSLNRVVAVKTILAGQFAGESDVKRFRLEAEAAANLQHPHIVAIHEIGEHAGQHYFSMDFIAGENLADHARAKVLDATEIAALVKTLAEAVHFAHQRGTLHRDLKPQNVLVDPQGRPHITDFGLAKKWSADDAGRGAANELTHPGTVMGSPSYMAPEQAAGQAGEIGPATDVYSLGGILYFLLTGQPPHSGATPMETLRRVVEEEPVAPRKVRAGTPPDLETIALKCLEKRPERRYATARQLAEELERFLHHEPILARPASGLRKAWSWTARRPWLIAVAASVLFAAAFGMAFELRERNRFERRQGLILQAQHLAESAPTDESRRDAQYAEAMALLRETAQVRADGDITHVALAVLARLGRPWRQVIHEHGRGPDVVLDAAMSSDGRHLVSAFKDGIVELFDAATGRSVFRTSRLDFAQPRVASAPAGAWIALADPTQTPGRVWLWRIAEPAPPLVIEAHAGAVNMLAFSPDGRLLAIGGQATPVTGQQPEIRFWDLEAGRFVQTIRCFGKIYPILERFHAKKQWLKIRNEFARLEFSSDGGLLFVRSDAGTTEIVRLGASTEPVIDAEVLRAGESGNRSWIDSVAQRDAGAAHALWREGSRWSYYRDSGAALAPSRAERAWRIEWNRELIGQRELMSPDHRFLSADNLASDLRARPPVAVPMPGHAFALTSDGAWVGHDPARAAFNFWRVSDVAAEWKRLGLWDAIREPPSDDLLFLAQVRVVLAALLSFVLGIAVTVSGFRLAMRRAHGPAPSRALAGFTLGGGAIVLLLGLGTLVRLGSLAVWSKIDVNTITLEGAAAATTAALWGLAAVVRSAQNYHAGLIGSGAARYRSSKIAWCGALLGGLLFVRALFPDALPQKRTHLMTPGVVPVEINVGMAWGTVLAAILLGFVATVIGTRVPRRGKAARRWALAGFAVVVIGWVFAAAAWLSEEVAAPALFGVGLGALLAVIVIPAVHEAFDQSQEERSRRTAEQEKRRGGRVTA